MALVCQPWRGCCRFTSASPDGGVVGWGAGMRCKVSMLTCPRHPLSPSLLGSCLLTAGWHTCAASPAATRLGCAWVGGAAGRVLAGATHILLAHQLARPVWAVALHVHHKPAISPAASTPWSRRCRSLCSRAPSWSWGGTFWPWTCPPRRRRRCKGWRSSAGQRVSRQRRNQARAIG